MTITEIKEQLKMSTVLAHYGLSVNKNKHLNCPFHDDKNPSMRYYADTNTVYCFSGNCQTHGHSLDVIDFIMKMENCSKHRAIMICKSMIPHATGGRLLGAESKTEKSPQQQIWTLLKKSMSKSERAKSNGSLSNERA